MEMCNVIVRSKEKNVSFFYGSRSQDREWGRGCEVVMSLPGVRDGEGYIGY